MDDTQPPSLLGDDLKLILLISVFILVIFVFMQLYKSGTLSTNLTTSTSTCPTGYVSASSIVIPAGTTLQPNDTQLIGTITYCNDGSTPIVGTAPTCPTGYTSATSSNIPNGITLQPNDTRMIDNTTYCNDGGLPIVGTFTSTCPIATTPATANTTPLGRLLQPNDQLIINGITYCNNTAQPINGIDNSFTTATSPATPHINTSINPPARYPTYSNGTMGNRAGSCPDGYIQATPNNVTSGVTLSQYDWIANNGNIYCNNNPQFIMGNLPNASPPPIFTSTSTSTPISVSNTQYVNTNTYSSTHIPPSIGVSTLGADCTREPLYLLQAKMYNDPTKTVSMPSLSLTEGSAEGWAPYNTTPIAYACSNQAFGTVPLYRGDEAGNTTGRHLTSMNPKEITNANFTLDFNGKPLAYVYPSQIPSTIPVIREYNPTDIDHIITTDITQWSSPWTPDQPSTIFYAFPTAS